MDHAITIGDVLRMSGLSLAVIIIIGGALWLLSLLASGWDH